MEKREFTPIEARICARIQELTGCSDGLAAITADCFPAVAEELDLGDDGSDNETFDRLLLQCFLEGGLENIGSDCSGPWGEAKQQLAAILRAGAAYELICRYPVDQGKELMPIPIRNSSAERTLQDWERGIQEQQAAVQDQEHKACKSAEFYKRRMDRIQFMTGCPQEMAARVLENVTADLDFENLERISDMEQERFDRMAVEHTYEYMVSDGGPSGTDCSMRENLEAAQALERTIRAYQVLAGYQVDLDEHLPADGFFLAGPTLSAYPEAKRWDTEVKRRQDAAQRVQDQAAEVSVVT